MNLIKLDNQNKEISLTDVQNLHFIVKSLYMQDNITEVLWDDDIFIYTDDNYILHKHYNEVEQKARAICNIPPLAFKQHPITEIGSFITHCFLHKYAEHLY